MTIFSTPSYGATLLAMTKGWKGCLLGWAQSGGVRHAPTEFRRKHRGSPFIPRSRAQAQVTSSHVYRTWLLSWICEAPPVCIPLPCLAKCSLAKCAKPAAPFLHYSFGFVTLFLASPPTFSSLYPHRRCRSRFCPQPSATRYLLDSSLIVSATSHLLSGHSFATEYTLFISCLAHKRRAS